jgi:hypothetical protein
MASTLCSCTAKETTLAIGASVPVTNAGPVTTVGVTGVEVVDPPPLEQPVATNAAAAKEASAKGNILSCVLESIKYMSSLKLVSSACCEQIEVQARGIASGPWAQNSLLKIMVGLGGRSTQLME